MISSIRLFFILPIVIFLLIALLKLLTGDFLDFILWSFASMVVFIILWPIIIKPDQRYIPVYQIFSLLISFLIVVTVFSFFDIAQYTQLSKDKVLILSFFAGVGTTIASLFIHGKRA